MHAIVVSKAGGPEVLEYREVPTPQVRPGWTRVRVRGFGINHSEIFTREGKSPSVTFPRILGIEAVGTVDETSAPERFSTGQTVVSLMGEMGRAYNGSYAEHVLLPNDQIFPISTRLGWADMAAIPETFYTAFGIYKSLQLKSEDRVLIRAVTSGVGVALLKLLKASGLNLHVAGTTRSTLKDTALHRFGIDQIVHTPNPNLLPQDCSTGDLEFDKIADLIGPSSVRDSLKHLAEFGIASSTGQLGGVWTLDGFDPITDIPNNRYLTGFFSGDVDDVRVQGLFDFLETHHVDVSPEKKLYPATHQAGPRIPSPQQWPRKSRRFGMKRKERHMKYQHMGHAAYLRVDRGEEILSTILAVCEEERILSATFSGIGACQSAVLSTYIPDKNDFIHHQLSGMLEMVSFNGNITQDENHLYQHAHATFSTLGENGHLAEATVMYTGEITIQPAEGVIPRKYDPETGITVWDL